MALNLPGSSSPFVLDTSVLRLLIDQRQQKEHPNGVARVSSVIAEHGICLAELTYYELRRGLEHLSLQKHKLKDVALGFGLLGTAEILPFTGRDRWDLAASRWAQLRQAGITLGENDFIILLTAMWHGRRLLTRDGQLVSNLGAAGPEYSNAVEFLALEPAGSAGPT